MCVFIKYMHVYIIIGDFGAEDLMDNSVNFSLESS